MMTKDNSFFSPDVNQLIMEKLKHYPEEVAGLALKAIQLSEALPEASVFEALQGEIRNVSRKQP